VKKFLKEYRVELGGLLLLSIAVLLLLNRQKIGPVRQAGQGFLSRIANWFGNLLDSINNLFARMTATEMLAWLLIVGGTLFILWRIRVRYLRSDHWQASTCPKCGSKIHRVHRTRLDRILGPIFLPQSARYRCSNSECRWSGLRQGRPQPAALQSQQTPGNRG
jgi:hypothetical protein